MQIVCIYAGVSPYEQKIDYIFNIFKNTLDEIGMPIQIINIAKLNLEYFNGKKQPIIESIFNSMKNAQGIIFATTAQRLAPNGAMQVFLEHLDYNLYGRVLEEKPCFSIITSSDNSEYMAGNYMNALIGSLGGISLNNMLIGKSYLNGIEASEETTKMIEKYAEDFYRIVKQNRKFFISTPFKSLIEQNLFNENLFNESLFNENTRLKEDFNNYTQKNENNKQIRNLTGTQVANLYKKEIENSTTLDKNYSIKNKEAQNIQQNSFNNINDIYKNQQEFNQQENYNNQQFKNQENYNNQQFNKQKFNNQENYKNQQQNNQQEINKLNNLEHNIFNNENYNVNNKNYTQSTNLFEDNIQTNDEISELAKLLSEKYEKDRNDKIEINQYMNERSFREERDIEIEKNTTQFTPSISTLKQKTQSLYHYFQPQLAQGVDTIMQINISGEEEFNGFFIIQNGECSYKEGINPIAEVSIISDSIVWSEVLSGKCTLQKAFMLGKLKVKGNFVIISKFEQLFKII